MMMKIIFRKMVIFQWIKKMMQLKMVYKKINKANIVQTNKNLMNMKMITKNKI